jgi:hypothetical protein
LKNCIKLSVLGALLASSVSFAFADNITLGSFATGTTAASLGFSTSQTAMNLAGFTAYAAPPAIASTPILLSGTASTYALAPNGVWGTPIGNSTWVGNAANAAPGGVAQAYGYYQYTTLFTAVGGSGYTGSIEVMADDTAEILLNGAVIVPFSVLGSDAHCADSGVSCLSGDIVALTGLTLFSGTDANMFTFVVEQAGTMGPAGNPTGVDFTAHLMSAVTPEPSSLILLGTGLLGVAGLLFRKRPTT